MQQAARQQESAVPSSTGRFAPGGKGKVDMAVVIAFVIAAAIEAAVYYWQSRPLFQLQEGTAHIARGQRPPTGFSLWKLGTEEQINLVDLRDKVVWLNFWGYWSSSSLHQLPEINQIYQRYKDNPHFAMVTVLCELPGRMPGLDPEMLPAAKKLIDQHQLELPIYLDDSGNARQLLSIDDNEYPMNMLIDAKGVIQGVWTLYHAGLHEEMMPILDQLLREAEIPQ